MYICFLIFIVALGIILFVYLFLFHFSPLKHLLLGTARDTGVEGPQVSSSMANPMFICPYNSPDFTYDCLIVRDFV